MSSLSARNQNNAQSCLVVSAFQITLAPSPSLPPSLPQSGQVISTRVDMFPKQYTDRLMSLQDSVEPIPTSVVKAVVRQDLLEGEPLENLFKEFDEIPLGSASIAQVHRAVLRDGREVAVKVQRPSEEPKLRGDIANLKAFSKRFRDSLPVDYYRVFCELERALTNELDFLAEAQVN